MSIEIRVKELAENIATQLRNVRVKQGTLTSLTTTEKSTIVGAINELVSDISNLSQIDDTADSTVTNKSYSANKVHSVVTTALAAALEGQDLSDLADQVTALAQADQGLVNAKAGQTFTNVEKAQARTNIGAVSSEDVGNTDRDFVADFNAIYNS